MDIWAYHTTPLSGEICGGVLMLNTPFGFPLLSKIWVEPAHRGQGIARKLWKHIEAEYPFFFWRSLAENPVVPFYKKQARGGCVKIGHRLIYFNRPWPKDAAAVSVDAIQWAFNLPFDFIKKELAAA